MTKEQASAYLHNLLDVTFTATKVRTLHKSRADPELGIHATYNVFFLIFFKQNFFTSSWTSAGFSEDCTADADYTSMGVTYSAVFFEPRDELGKEEKLVCYSLHAFSHLHFTGGRLGFLLHFHP
jgi:hypothetical protein